MYFSYVFIYYNGVTHNILIYKQGDDGLFNENGMPKEKRPNHWKGKKGIYCVGFASAGLDGISNDAKNIVEDISGILNKR